MDRIILLSLILLAACSVSVRVPGNRFQTSEAIGEMQRPWIGVGLAGMIVADPGLGVG